MPLEEPQQWKKKASDFLSSSSFKLKQAGQSASENVNDVKGKLGSMFKSRWATFQDSRQRRVPPVESVQERIVSAAASTGVILKKGFTEAKEKVSVGKIKVEEAARKASDRSKNILNNIERWQKGVASNDVFSTPIEVTVQREHSLRAIPQLLVRCADFLVMSGLQAEYLFRSEGDTVVVRQLISLYNQDWNAPLPEGVSAIDVAALIKCYFASLPEPLTTFTLYHQIKNARGSVSDLRNVLKRLPNVNFMTLEYITALLLQVSKKSSLTKMDSRSLAVEFAPLIMWQEGDAGADLRMYLRYTLKPPPKIIDTTPTHTIVDFLAEEDDELEAATQIPLHDNSLPPDYAAIEVIQCLIEHHNAVFTDAHETVWR